MKSVLPALLLVISLLACSSPSVVDDPEKKPDISVDSLFAEVESVSVSGDPDSYTFSVELSSPDTGCDQYANWWGVLTEDGTLLYRRILAHSHISEQPFTRSGGPVAIGSGTTVLVRGHMDPHGYGSFAMKGSPASGFEKVRIDPTFAEAVATEAPQPNVCTN